MPIVVKVDGLFGGYHKDIVLKNVSFEIERGEFLGIIGPNGSGKSTLLRLMSRALSPQQGTITFEDKDITKINLKQLYKKMAFVGQDTLINFPFSVWEIVLMGRIPHLRRLQAEGERDFLSARNALLSTDALHLKEKEIDQLSAGERQRVIIAKALAQGPILLFLDEPTSHLDIGHQIQILDLLKKLNRNENLTIVMVLHDLNLASEYCNRLILLNDGCVYKNGSPEEVLTYQNIEAVYKTIVVVDKHPQTGKPFVRLISQEISKA